MGLEPIKFEAVHNEGSYYTANMKEVIRKVCTMCALWLYLVCTWYMLVCTVSDLFL